MKRLVAVLVLLGLSACATYENKWQEHGPIPQVGEAVIEAPVEAVWQRLKQGLEQDRFVIVKEDAGKRELTVLRSERLPSVWIDCGQTDIYKKNFVQELHNYVASANSMAYERYALLIYYVYRHTALEAQSIARLTDRAGATAMTVDTTYTLTIRRSKKVLSPGVPVLIGSGAAFIGGMEQVDMGDAEVTRLTFGTDERSAPFEEFRCVARGNLEERIIKMASTPAPGS